MEKEEELAIKIIESSLVAIAASFPVAASLAAGWSEYKNHKQANNISSVLRFFDEKIECLHSRIDKIYLESEDMKSLVLKTCLTGKDEVSEDKKKYLGYFLANACTVEHSRDSIKRTILDTLSKMSDFEFFTLKLLHGETYENWEIEDDYTPENQAWVYLGEKNMTDLLSGHSKLDVISTLEYLNAIGVIENITSRGNGASLEGDVKEIIITQEIDSLIQEELELSKNPYLNGKRLNEIRAQMEDLEKKLDESRGHDKFRYQKYYSISALGSKLMSYIK